MRSVVKRDRLTIEWHAKMAHVTYATERSRITTRGFSRTRESFIAPHPLLVKLEYKVSSAKLKYKVRSAKRTQIVLANVCVYVHTGTAVFISHCVAHCRKLVMCKWFRCYRTSVLFPLARERYFRSPRPAPSSGNSGPDRVVRSASGSR